ncbi:MAG: zinc-dependent metalloprotease [Deltaproteobacteria bacterium]|nr:zinc-dependent metalloprotease [Deltaproteobacteria bacterium]
MRRRNSVPYALLLLLVLPGSSWSQDPFGALPCPPPRLRSYDEVVPKDTASSRGLFTVFRVGERVLYEIPPERFGRDMLWYTEVSKVPAGVGHGGLAIGSRCVRWERQGGKVLLRLLSFGKRSGAADPGDPLPIQRAVQEASLPAVVMAFDVEAEGEGGAPVIDVTRLLTSNVDEFSAERVFTQSGISVRRPDGRPDVDAARSYVEGIKVFQGNIETRSVITFRIAPPGIPEPGAYFPPASRPGNIWSGSLLVHYSMTLLPEIPMRPRVADPRVGYFVQSYEDYSRGENRVLLRQYINRFRLEKRDPEAAVSEPIAPIVFYIGRQVPRKWRPYIRRAVEDWKPAFEASGFRDAILVRDAPTEEEDPGWDPEDTRYSVIRWAAAPLANALGPSVQDPRSGQILSATIFIYQDILKLAQQWYFAMCSALDPRAERLPFPDELTGELLRYIVAHEVGHTIGLRHNHKASSAFTVEQLRSPDFTARYGTVASITSYGRFNYVAQPGDEVGQLIPKVGPYDDFAVEWGYRPIPEASGPEEERPILDALAARQIENPWLQFGGEDGPAQVDPTVMVQAIGSDPIRSTDLGLRNLNRAFDLLLPATTQLGEDFTLLAETYRGLLDVRNAWLVSVASLVGGVVETRTLGGRGGDQFTRVTREKQREAVRFLLEQGLKVPSAVARPELLNRFCFLGVSDIWMEQQSQLLERLLRARTYKLLRDAEILDPRGAYRLTEFLADLQAGIFEEVAAEAPVVDAERRVLQRQYLARLRNQIAEAAADTDVRAVGRGALGSLRERLMAALSRTQEEMTRVHFRECLREIALVTDAEPALLRRNGASGE